MWIWKNPVWKDKTQKIRHKVHKTRQDTTHKIIQGTHDKITHKIRQKNKIQDKTHGRQYKTRHKTRQDTHDRIRNTRYDTKQDTIQYTRHTRHNT